MHNDTDRLSLKSFCDTTSNLLLPGRMRGTPPLTFPDTMSSTKPKGFGHFPPKDQGKSKAKQSKSSTVQNIDSQRQKHLFEQAVEDLFQQEFQDPEQTALAWEIGVYNPLAHIDPRSLHSRTITPQEQQWLQLAGQLRWLKEENSLHALFFTTPPPAFDPKQADWYVLPVPHSIFNRPILLCEAPTHYPISIETIDRLIEIERGRLGWSTEALEEYAIDFYDLPLNQLSQDDRVDLLDDLLEMPES